jgi:hypothetical protein
VTKIMRAGSIIRADANRWRGRTRTAEVLQTVEAKPSVFAPTDVLDPGTDGGSDHEYGCPLVQDGMEHRYR